MKKLELDSKKLFTLAGAAVAVGSLIAIADFADRKKQEKTAYTAELLAGIAGLAVGVALATTPRRQVRKEQVLVEDMFNDEDAALAHEQIRETLNKETDRGEQSTGHLRTIEVDSETSIEDFI